MQVIFFGIRVRCIGGISGPSKLCRSIFGPGLRCAGGSLVSVYAQQVKFGVRLHYAGLFVFVVRLRCAGEIRGPSTPYG